MKTPEQIQQIQARIDEAQSYIIRYPVFVELTNMIEHCMNTSRSAKEPQCAALDGKTGAGKTTIAQELAKKYPRYETETHDVIPILYLLVKAPTTAVGLVSSLLDALGDPLAYKGTRYERINRLVKWLRKCKVLLVILDDFHHLIDSNTGKVLKDVANCLKGVIKDSGVAFLVIGIQGKVDIILESDGTSELSRLFAERKTLHPFIWDASEPDTIRAIDKFISYAEKTFSMRFDIPVERIDLLFRIHYGTDGFIANIMNLLHYAYHDALYADQSTFTLRGLAAAFDARLAKHIKKPNPFINIVFAAPKDDPAANDSQPEGSKGDSETLATATPPTRKRRGKPASTAPDASQTDNTSKGTGTQDDAPATAPPATRRRRGRRPSIASDTPEAGSDSERKS